MNYIQLILFSLPLALVAFIFEIYPRLANRKFGVDVWTHLLYLKEYHKQKGIPKKIENGFLVPGEYDYPPAFIFILSLFPFRIVKKYEFAFSPFFDVLHLIIIFLISYSLTENLLIALLTQALYILTPIIVLENSSATPRSLGYTLFTIFLFSLFLFTQTGMYYLLAIAVFSSTIILLSHRFTSQSVLFFSVFFSIIEKNIIYIEAFAISFFLAIIVSKGFYLKVLRGHLGNLSFWYKNINYRFSHQVKGNYRQHKTGDFIFKLYNQFLKFPPFMLTITNPWTLPSLYMFLFSNPANPILQKMVWWVVFSYILATVTTWVPKLRFLGEGQRYLELSAFPAALLSSIFFVDMMNTNLSNIVAGYYVLVGIASFLTIIIIQRKGIIKDKLRTVTPDMEEMFSYLKNLKNKPKLLCIPHQITTNTIYHTGCPVFVNASYWTINLISDVYPYLRKNARDILKEKNLDAILLNEDY
ncbi:MAG: hypothetical protein WD967_02075, partial [Candidatus Levyibacteriota bacterium]